MVEFLYFFAWTKAKLGQTPLSLIEGVEKLCKDLGVDLEDVRTFRFPPHPLRTLSCPCLFVCLFFFLCCSCMASRFTFARPHQPCARLSIIKRGHIIIITIIHLPVLEAHVQQQFFVHFFKPHFATEQSETFMSLSWMLADLFLSFCLCRL